MLERILQNELYKPENNSEESKKRIVRLTDNYRSHPEISKFSNDTFYNSLMETVVIKQNYDAFNWKHLPNHTIPYIFHSVESEAEEIKEFDGFSLFNLEEVTCVSDYVKNLLECGLPERKVIQRDIGIASPYVAQVKELRNCMKNYPLIDIGTTEFFQGREKPIIIISAVKTKDFAGRFDFLDNSRVTFFKKIFLLNTKVQRKISLASI